MKKIAERRATELFENTDLDSQDYMESYMNFVYWQKVYEALEERYVKQKTQSSRQTDDKLATKEDDRISRLENLVEKLIENQSTQSNTPDMPDELKRNFSPQELNITPIRNMPVKTQPVDSFRAEGFTPTNVPMPNRRVDSLRKSY